MSYFLDKTYKSVNFGETPLDNGEYEGCVFENCDFSSCNLNQLKFVDCQFVSCNLSLVKVNGTAFRDCQFQSSKLLGIRFEDCNPIGFFVQYENCILNHCSFYDMKLKKTRFIDCQMDEVDFTLADLSQSLFHTTSLRGAIFQNSILAQADFRTATHFQIDPTKNRLKKARFSKDGLIGLTLGFGIQIEQ